jgi:hypothetical protein
MSAAVARLSDEQWRQILVHCPRSTTKAFALVSHKYSHFADRILYRRVSLSFPQALLLFRTLRGRSALGANVSTSP